MRRAASSTSGSSVLPSPRSPGSWTRLSRYSSRPLPTASGSWGQAHPDILTSRDNLAIAYKDAGRLDEAEG
jgi:hypothetical protein